MEAHLTLVPLRPWYRFRFADGDHFDYGGTMEETLAEIARIEPGDQDGYLKLLAHSRRIFDVGFTELSAQPFHRLGTMLRQASSIPYADRNYLYLVAANIGAVIMPWMVFYQQSAIADKGLQPRHFRAARIDTALGAVLTQLIMASVLIAVAATLGHGGHDCALRATRAGGGERTVNAGRNVPSFCTFACCQRSLWS